MLERVPMIDSSSVDLFDAEPRRTVQPIVRHTEIARHRQTA